MSDGEVNQWASFTPALVACCTATEGPIFEAGCGYNSTPLLHAICAPWRRDLLTLDGNREWLAHFRNLETDWHALRHVDDWQALDLGDQRFGVAFVDHDVAPRGPVVEYLREWSDLVVMHDSECHYCGYSEPLSKFAWAYTHKFSPAWTTIAGMANKPTWLETALQPGDWGIPVPYRG